MNYTQPYYGSNPYMYQQPMYQQNSQQFNQQMAQQINQPINQPKMQQTNMNFLQGKNVDSLEVVKAMDIPLDGSISYFPLADGTAIITKQLQLDGTSKTIVYKPVEDKEIKDNKKFLTEEDVTALMKKYDNKSLEEEIKTLKRKLKDLAEDVNDIITKKEVD